MTAAKRLISRALRQASLQKSAWASGARSLGPKLPAIAWTSASHRHAHAQTQARFFGTSPPRLSASGSSAPFAMGPESAEVKALVASGWQLDDSQFGISKTFYFKTFTKCQDFFNLIAIRSKSAKHHSTTTIKFRSVHVHWTTHSPASLSSLDVMMAQFCEDQAKLVGDVDASQITTC